MILLFTSKNCTWCSILRDMLENENKALGTEQQIYEVNVEKQHRIAEAYGILAVPTLVAGSFKISGVPTSGDLRSFLLQAISLGFLKTGSKIVKTVLQDVHQIRSSGANTSQLIKTAT
ncbi:MAG: thioredoxin family protein [Promethearchaeota archaeon]